MTEESDVPVLCNCLGPGAEVGINEEQRLLYCMRCFRSFDPFRLAVFLIEQVRGYEYEGIIQ